MYQSITGLLFAGVLAAGCTSDNPLTSPADDPSIRAAQEQTLDAARAYTDGQVAQLKLYFRGVPGPVGPQGPSGPVLHLVDKATGEDLGALKQDDIADSAAYGGEVAWTRPLNVLFYDAPGCPADHAFVNNGDAVALAIGAVGRITPGGDVYRPRGEPVAVAPLSTYNSGKCDIVGNPQAFATDMVPMAASGFRAVARKAGDLQRVFK